MIEWIKTQVGAFDDPYFLLVAAPVIFGVIYILTSFFGERG